MTFMFRIRSVLCALMLTVCSLATVGCESYALRGAVVEGQMPGVYIVRADDARLEQVGLANAVVEPTLDPDSMRPKQLSNALTDDRGRFELPVTEFGAGILEYELGLLVRHEGFKSVWQKMPMPPGNRRLLVVMAPGEDRGGVGGPRENDWGAEW